MIQKDVNAETINDFFLGKKLYGDDFNEDQLKIWWEEEREGYSRIVASRQDEYRYQYHALNRFHLFRHVRIPLGAHALGLGSAFGYEFLPIIDRLSKVTIIEPSEKFKQKTVLKGIAFEYRKPRIDGQLEFPENHFQLAISMGVLHHIANVSAVLREIYRCLAPDCYMLIREPIVTQGDWRNSRNGLTKNERGIPYGLFQEILLNIGFRIEYCSLFDFTPFTRAMAMLGKSAFNSSFATLIDWLLSRLFSFNTKYHRTRLIERFGPASVAIVACKPVL